LLSEKQELLRDNDALLQASRRLDWRFLLPEPELGRVACVGVDDPDLVESLRLFSSGFSAADAAASRERASYDVVVLRNPTSEDLAEAVSLLRSGGWAYVEVEGSLSPRRSGRGRSARGYANALRRLGLVDVGAYLHWPDFDSCRAIVALDDAVAVRHALARARRGSRARIVRRLAPVLATTNLLAAVAPCASVVGRRAMRSEEGGG
jgi:hypothetical protein